MSSKYENLTLRQLDDAVCDGRNGNNAEDLRQLAVTALRRIADEIAQKPITEHTPDDKRANLAIARRRMLLIDRLFTDEAHPPIEYMPGGTTEELAAFGRG